MIRNSLPKVRARDPISAAHYNRIVGFVNESRLTGMGQFANGDHHLQRRISFGGSGKTVEFSVGLVFGGSIATAGQSGNDVSRGELEVRPYLTESDIPLHDDASAYVGKQPCRLTASDHDESTDYADGSVVLHGGNVHQNQTGSENSAGTFANQTWVELGSPGVYFADSNLSAGTFDDQDWTAATGERFVDRSQAVITLDNPFTDAVINGAIAIWTDTFLIGYGCRAQTGFSE